MSKMLNQVEKLAATALATHAISKVGEGHWSCSNGGFCYWFYVKTWGEWLLIYGDCGSLLLRRTTDMIKWSRGAIGDPNYFAEKVVSSMPTKKGKDYDANFAWCYHSMKWFLANMSE